MIQNAIKVLTLGFFISMITGFVMYRTGAFDSTTASSALHTSPNGGELNNANQAPSSTGNLEINQQNTNEIMPSSKSLAPAIDLKKYEQEKKKELRMSSSKSMMLPNDFKIDVEDIKKEYVSSSKSMLHPIKVEPTANKMSEKDQQQIAKLQPKFSPTTSDTKQDITSDPTKDHSIKSGEREEIRKTSGVYWGLVGLGVLGIVFVGIGIFVYFRYKLR